MKRELYRGDCLDILTENIDDNSIDLVYLDPPFNSKSDYNLPFRHKDKSYSPVEAFVDTWTWTGGDDLDLADMASSFDPRLKMLANLVQFAQSVEHNFETGSIKRGRSSLAAYLLNMSQRLLAVRRVLKDSGSIYLHCDPTAGHYLKLLMDVIFDKDNFRNEIIWHYYNKYGAGKRVFGRNYDLILFYSMNDRYTFHPLRIKRDKPQRQLVRENVDGVLKNKRDKDGRLMYRTVEDKKLDAVWTIPCLQPASKERLGFPTQKPLALLERIIKASSNPGDIVLDPFCGCGTTVHAAEALDRQWIGIDISGFSTELMRERILSNFAGYLSPSDIHLLGIPETPAEARQLARENPFEFEKWVCGRIGANGMGIRRRPGDKGADGGIDGVIELDVIRGQKVVKEYAIVQVKGGSVSPDAVKALSETVRRLDAIAGILVCFGDQLATVENQRSRETWADDYAHYPVIQGYSVESLLADERLQLPSRYGRKRGGRMTALL